MNRRGVGWRGITPGVGLAKFLLGLAWIDAHGAPGAPSAYSFGTVDFVVALPTLAVPYLCTLVLCMVADTQNVPSCLIQDC